MKQITPWFALVILLGVTAFAQNAQLQNSQDKDALPNTYLTGKHILSFHPAPGGPYASQKHLAAAVSRASTGVTNNAFTSTFPRGVDTLVNFLGDFSAPGININGKPNDHWQYSMVGNPPSIGKTTTINAPVIPVTINMLNADGSPRSVVTNTTNCPHCTPSELGKTIRLRYNPAQYLTKFLTSPVFANSTYSSSEVPTQITDAIQKAEFGKNAQRGWHTLLAPSLKPGLTMALIEGTYRFALNDDGSCCAFVLVDINVFGNELFPPTAPPDNSTVVGSAEVAGYITTKDISTFFFPNTYLYFNGNPNDCCVLGYHTFDFEPGDNNNGGLTRFYVLNYSSWISPGLFGAAGKQTCATDADDCIQDVTAHSHEIAETFNDPFVGFDNIHNITPFWENPAGQCQDIMEVGDVIEDLPNPTYPVTLHGFTYHPQTEALLPWFEFKSPSTADNNAYSYPNETVLTQLSAQQPFNCGQ